MASLIEVISATERFFSICELVSLVLHQAETLVLLKAVRVCRLWRQIIEESELLQEELFFKSSIQQGDDNPRSVRLNPILSTHFTPLLAFDENQTLFPAWSPCPLQSKTCSYSDLAALPWARDGFEADAPARRAFARKEASWRCMLISQPPIKRLDWSHSWNSAEHTASDKPFICGAAHEYFDGPITIGLLWDWMEARLLRGCSIQTTIFPAGSSVKADPSKKEFENLWHHYTEFHPGSRRGNFSASRPRIRIQSLQIWPGSGPSWYQEFDVAQRVWIIQDEYPVGRESRRVGGRWDWSCQNGCKWLVWDCQRDSEDREKTWRWSKSDAFEGKQSNGFKCKTPGVFFRSRIEARRGFAVLPFADLTM